MTRMDPMKEATMCVPDKELSLENSLKDSEKLKGVPPTDSRNQSTLSIWLSRADYEAGKCPARRRRFNLPQSDTNAFLSRGVWTLSCDGTLLIVCKRE